MPRREFRRDFHRIATRGSAAIFLGSALVAAATRSPMLQTRTYPVNARVFPDSTNQEQFRSPAFLVSLAPRPGCLRIVRLETGSAYEVCNETLHCAAPSEVVATVTGFEVFRRNEDDSFYVDAGSQCNSSCCDYRGTVVSAEGKRQDDTVFKRIWLRLGPVGWLGVAVGVAGWLAGRPRQKSLVMPVIGALGTTVSFMVLWYHM